MQHRFVGALAWLTFFSVVASLHSAPPDARGVALDRKTYPQSTPKETLASVVQAIESKRIDYLLTHLAEPKWVEEQLEKRHRGDYTKMVADAREQLTPYTARLLAKFLEKGKWKIDKDSASVALETLQDKSVYFQKIDGQWYMTHRWAENEENKTP